VELYFLVNKSGKAVLKFFAGAGMETYLTAKEVALLLQLSVATIRRYTMLNEIPFHKANRAVRYKKSEIEVWFESRKTGKPETKTEKDNGGLFRDLESDV
jgi:excisionase family DNA binding protein